MRIVKRTREAHKEQFYKYYVPNDEESVVQLDEADHLFLSNAGHLYSTWKHNNLEMLSPLLVRGNKRYQRSYYDIKGKHIPMHKLVSKYFPNKFNPDNRPDESLQTHHVEPYSRQKSEYENNCSGNLLTTSKDIHNILTSYSRSILDIQNGTVTGIDGEKINRELTNIDADKNFMVAAGYKKETGECVETNAGYVSNELLQEGFNKLMSGKILIEIFNPGCKVMHITNDRKEMEIDRETHM